MTETLRSNSFNELNYSELYAIDGGFNLETIGKGFIVFTSTITTVCLLTGGAAATAAVSTIAAPVIVLGVLGAAAAGLIIGHGITH